MEEIQPQQKPRKWFIQFLFYLCFSLGAGVIEFVSFTLISLISSTKVCLIIAEVTSVVLSCTFNFTLNRKYTFKSCQNIFVGLIAYLVLYAIITPLGAWFIVGMTNIGVHSLLAKAMKMLMTFATEFLFCKFILFRIKPPKNKENENATEGVEETKQQ